MKEINAFRHFNRFYTRVLGLFSPRIIGSDKTLVEARILYELWQRPGLSSADLGRLLDMDRGQLSRVLARLARQGLVAKPEKHAGRRAIPLDLTAEGLAQMLRLDALSSEQARGLLEPLGPQGRSRLALAMAEIEGLLAHGGPAPDPAGVVLRAARTGELGWLIHRYALLHRESHGFNEEFEKYLVLGMAEYLDGASPGSRLWVAEREGDILGCIAIVDKGAGVAQLRWLVVEPHARGLGLGRRLVERAVAFAREAGHRRIFLWTIDSLTPAITLYRSVGFVRTEIKRGLMGGVELTEERMDLEL